ETIVRMKARLWFVHRGMEKLFEGRTPAEGIELAERISGDTSVGHTLGYAMAVEAALGVRPSEADVLVRAMLLELERVHNHVSDLGAICNDVGFGIVHQHTQRLREQLLRANRQITGHRLLRGAIGIGGARVRALPDVAALAAVGDQVGELVQIALGSSVLVDRFTGTAVLADEEARAMGVLGYVARASGLDIDARRDHPWVDLGPGFAVPTGSSGDVLARFTQRVDELAVSLTVVAHLVERLDGRLGAGPAADLRMTDGAGSALVEAWRGTACHRVELAHGRLSRVAVVDPSFFTWPALPVALADTIVPDFPLANKSFNQSYAGNDL
ncbi:MAG: nickel-dependent hydrogenase large subunit, partial [Cellulomonas sp.]|nr:nickel-dependent hydrogenase large subunit [Cellulomonas sp.]